MDTIINHAQQAFDLVCSIMVKGDDVERLLNVKNHLREIYRLATQPSEESEESKNGG